ncbi:hypothetical protein Q4553_13265 [Tenacibaculum soleae]|uniref:hypothetical protein n=1 Tax=Tenacibaculum soleae TaxID=447689 RepID=UPI0026E32543|nr:hypothetical protein [Tenacibaculum soleae]MDO6745537.1 hypothetical protein [Tenacibaculum soleae]
MKLNIHFLILILTFTSCANKEKQPKINESIITETEESKIEQKPENINIETKYCFIKNLTEKNGKNYIIADFVDFLTDEKAIEKAKQNGDADFDINKKGDTIYFVYNDYYVSNVNPKLRTLELIPQIRIELWNYPKNNGIFNTVNINELNDHLSSKPIMILKIKNGIVTEMREQYVP